MGKASLQTGVLDKAGRNVKTEKGWVTVKGNEKLIDWALEENKRHDKKDFEEKKAEVKKETSKKGEKQTISKDDVGDLGKVLGLKGGKKETKKATNGNVKKVDGPIWLHSQKQIFDWGLASALKNDKEEVVITLTEANIAALQSLDPGHVIEELVDKDGKVFLVLYDKFGDMETVSETFEGREYFKFVEHGKKGVDFYVSPKCVDFDDEKNVHDYRKPNEEEKKDREKEVKKARTTNNKLNAKK